MSDEPDAFRSDRPSARDHLAFGGGPHVCPADGYRREQVPVFWANGPRTLPTTLTARPERRGSHG